MPYAPFTPIKISARKLKRACLITNFELLILESTVFFFSQIDVLKLGFYQENNFKPFMSKQLSNMFQLWCEWGMNLIKAAIWDTEKTHKNTN